MESVSNTTVNSQHSILQKPDTSPNSVSTFAQDRLKSTSTAITTNSISAPEEDFIQLISCPDVHTDDEVLLKHTMTCPDCQQKLDSTGKLGQAVAAMKEAEKACMTAIETKKQSLQKEHEEHSNESSWSGAFAKYSQVGKTAALAVFYKSKNLLPTASKDVDYENEAAYTRHVRQEQYARLPFSSIGRSLDRTKSNIQSHTEQKEEISKQISRLNQIKQDQLLNTNFEGLGIDEQISELHQANRLSIQTFAQSLQNFRANLAWEAIYSLFGSREEYEKLPMVDKSELKKLTANPTHPIVRFQDGHSAGFSIICDRYLYSQKYRLHLDFVQEYNKPENWRCSEIGRSDIFKKGQISDPFFMTQIANVIQGKESYALYPFGDFQREAIFSLAKN